jgi:hypothetical protein
MLGGGLLLYAPMSSSPVHIAAVKGLGASFCHVLGLRFVTSGERMGFVAKI